MPIFAAVDIGANSVRLKIARLANNRLAVIHEDREVTRLGEGVFRGGALSPEAMEHTVKVLRRFHRSVQRYAAAQVRVVATSALRDARNQAVFCDWVRSATGWPVEVISGLEEGRLIHLGVMSNMRINARNVLLVDLGGGSCELTISIARQIRHMVSLPLGAVRLTQEFLRHDPPKKKEIRRLREFIAEEVRRAEKRIAGAHVKMAIATSGTAAALHGMWMTRASRQGIGAPRTVPTSGMMDLAAKLGRSSLRQRLAMSGMGPRRAEIIVAGAVVFAELFHRSGLPSFRYSALGLRDGLLAQMAADYGQSSRLQKQIQSQRRDALVAAGRHYGVDLKHAERVRSLVMRLFGALKSVHRLPAEYQEWLGAAAMLYEVGAFLNRAGRYRHAYYIIAHSEIFGFTVLQRRLIATIARYVGKSKPDGQDRALRLLPAAERDYIAKAVALLRLASALDQSRRGAVTRLAVRAVGRRVMLHLTSGPRGVELELWALSRRAPYFREVFGRELKVSAA